MPADFSRKGHRWRVATPGGVKAKGATNEETMSRTQQGRHQTDAMVYATDAQRRGDWKTFNQAKDEVTRIGHQMGIRAQTPPDFPALGSSGGEAARGEIIRSADVRLRSRHRHRPRGRTVVGV